MYENCFLDIERRCEEDCAAFVRSNKVYTHCKILNGFNTLVNAVENANHDKPRRHHPRSAPPPEVRT